VPSVSSTARRRSARLLTEVGAPVIVLVLAPLVVSIHAEPSLGSGVGWGLLAALFFGVIPFGYVLRGVRQGRWSDRHVGTRQQRKPVFFFSLGSMLAGVAILAIAGAPRDLVAFLITLLIEAGLALLVTLAWKVSLHAWVATIGATALVTLYGIPALILWPFLAGVGWSRVELEDHTLPQVVVGAVIGTATTAVLFPLLR